MGNIICDEDVKEWRMMPWPMRTVSSLKGCEMRDGVESRCFDGDQANVQQMSKRQPMKREA